MSTRSGSTPEIVAMLAPIALSAAGSEARAAPAAALNIDSSKVPTTIFTAVTVFVVLLLLDMLDSVLVIDVLVAVGLPVMVRELSVVPVVAVLLVSVVLTAIVVVGFLLVPVRELSVVDDSVAVVNVVVKVREVLDSVRAASLRITLLAVSVLVTLMLVPDVVAVSEMALGTSLGTFPAEEVSVPETSVTVVSDTVDVSVVVVLLLVLRVEVVTASTAKK